MSELIVKDNALMNASYNLDLVEQRLILLAILKQGNQAKESMLMTSYGSCRELYQSIWCS